MSKHILIISTSPRKGGNSDVLADEFARGAQEAGNHVEKVALYDQTVGFCKGCLACQSTGHCVIHDDANAIVEKMLTADVIVEISGILNGTTNYMLTKMSREGLNYDDVLKEAQAKGYAELHPEADVEGWDACRKIAILTSLASGNQVDFKDIYTEGITKVTAEDFAYAKKAGCAIKLLAVSKKQGDTYCVMVAPAFVRKENPLYMVNDVFNAVCVEGNMLGASMFYGSGAGKLPTASAVAGDMVDAARHLGKIITTFWNPQKLELAPVGEMTHRFFVRMKSDAKDAKVFGDVEMIDAKIKGEIGFMTPVMSEDAFARKAKNLDIISMIRVEG